jgi:hypothetical protein
MQTVFMYKDMSNSSWSLTEFQNAMNKTFKNLTKIAFDTKTDNYARGYKEV